MTFVEDKMMKDKLSRFCFAGPNRIGIDRPFSRGVHTFRTNGQLIIRTVREGEYEDNSAVKMYEFEWDHGDITDWENLENFDLPDIKYETCLSCDGLGKIRKCSDCHGEGKHECDNCGTMVGCADCNGEGWIPGGDTECDHCVGEGRNPVRNYYKLNDKVECLDQSLHLVMSLSGVQISIKKIVNKRLPFRAVEGVGYIMTRSVK